VTPLFPLTLGLAPYARDWVQVLPNGSYSLSTTGVWSNTLRYDPDGYLTGLTLIVDGESYDQLTSFRLGMGAGMELSAWLGTNLLFNGILDGPISWFHRAFGFANQARDDFADNRIQIRVVTPKGVLLDVRSPAAGISSWGLGFSWIPPLDLPLAFNFRIKAPAPHSAHIIFADQPALESSLAWNPSRSPLDIGLAIGIAFQGNEPVQTLFASRQLLLQGSGHIFFIPKPSLYLGVEAVTTQSPILTDELYLGGLASNIWIGGKYSIGRHWVAEAALIEEFFSWASIEVGLSFGLEYRGSFHP
jgi:hypothetical protein